MAVTLPKYPINQITTGSPASTDALNAPIIEIEEDLEYLRSTLEDVTDVWVTDGSGNAHTMGSIGIGVSNPTAGLEVTGTFASNGIDDQSTTKQITITDSKINAELLVPTGIILSYCTSTVPTGWLECDGAGFNETTYSELANILWDNSKYIYGGNTHTNGSGTGHFYLPDLRGKFMRGWDHGAGNDPDAGSRSAAQPGGASGDNVGSYQSDQIKSHAHVSNLFTYTAGPNNNYTASAGDFNLIGTQSQNPFGGNETRPKNINVMYIIKY